MDDHFSVQGWAWEEANPNKPTELHLRIDDDLVATVFPQDFRADLYNEGISHGCFAFRWKIPSLFFDGKSHAISILHVSYDVELPNSPQIVMLPAMNNTGSAEAETQFQNPDLSYWPEGLQGDISKKFGSICPGLLVHSEADEQFSAAFMVIEPRLTKNRSFGYYGVRIEVETAAALWIHHQFKLDSSSAPVRPTQYKLEASLGEADDSLTQRPAELWLTRQSKDRFDQIRRLSRARVFRRPTVFDLSILLTEEECRLARARILFLSLRIDNCKSIRYYPPRIVTVNELPAEGFISFEDQRLNSTFLKCRELALLHGHDTLLDEIVPRDPAELLNVQMTKASVRQTLPTRMLPRLGYPLTQIIVPVYNGGGIVVDCIRSVLRNTDIPFQIIVVDDGSRANTKDMLRDVAESDARIILLDFKKNRGYTKSVNEAVRVSSAEWLVVLNSDTLVTPGWLTKMHNAAASSLSIGMVGPLSNAASWQSIPNVKDLDGGWATNDFIKPHNLTEVQGVLDSHSAREYPEVPLLNGFCTLIRHSVFESCGVYDEDAFPVAYGEETDLCIRAGKAGFKLVIADDCFVFHHKSVSFGTAGRRPLSKMGGNELQNKHLDVSVQALEQTMRDNPALTRLRKELSDLRQRLSQ